MNVVVTGSSSGIGRALAEHLAATGHNVWGLARSDPSETTASNPSKIRATKCDVASWDAVSAAAKEVAAAWGHVDALVTCAAVQGEVGRAVAADPKRWSETVRINLDGTLFSIRGFHPLLMKAKRRAKIVCFSGGGATKARPNFSAYGVAKTAVVRLVETIAEEERGSALDINALAPGAINTRLTDEVLALGPSVVGKAEFEAATKQKASGGGSMKRALETVGWMISEASDGISGRLLSAAWDPISDLSAHRDEIAKGDVYQLRRITSEDRKLKF